MFCSKATIGQPFIQKPAVAIVQPNTAFRAGSERYQGKFECAELECEMVEEDNRVVMIFSQVENAPQISRFEKRFRIIEVLTIKGDDFIHQSRAAQDGRTVSACQE